MRKLCNDHDNCHMIMPDDGKAILIYNQIFKSLKTLFFFLSAHGIVA